MLILVLIKFAQHMQKSYIFTDLIGSFTCPYGTMIEGNSVYTFIDPIRKSILSCSGANYLIFLPAPEIEPGLPAWAESALKHQTTLFPIIFDYR